MTPPPTVLGVLGLGFALGLRHALDADHLAAVSTIVSGRRGLVRSSLVGAIWGLGHTAALLAVAVAVVALRAEIPPRLGQGLELGVAVMLIVLGANVLRVHPHRPGASAGRGRLAAGRRPFLVGLVHGVAGSAGLMLGVLATIPSPPLALAYVATFGCGSIGGMAVMSALLGLPLALAAERWSSAEQTLRSLAGVASVAVGILLAWEVT